MADRETGLNIPIGAYADENSAKKAIQDLIKSVLGALKDGYIEVPTAISDEFDKSKASAKLIRAQKDFINQWEKMSKEGFSSSEEDLQSFVDKFTEFKRLMGKEGKGGSKQNLAIRDLGLNELVQSYKKQLNTIQSQIKVETNKQTKVNSTRQTKRSTKTTNLPSDEKINANIKQEKDRRYKGLTETGPRGYKTDSGFDTGIVTSKTILDTERGGSHSSNLASQMAKSRQESKKWEKESLITIRPGKKEIEQAIKDAFSRGNNKNNFTDEELAISKRDTTSSQLAKILDGIENNEPDATIKQFNDYLQGVFAFNDKAGKSDWEAISLSLNKTFNRYFNTKGTLGVTDGSPKGVGEGHANAEIAIAGMFEKFKEVLEKNGLTAELDRVNKTLIRIDPRLVEAANSLNTVTTSTTTRQTVSDNSILAREIQSLNQEQRRQTTALESQNRLSIMENSAERISDNETESANKETIDIARRDADTGFNTEPNAKEMFSHQMTTNRLLGEIKDALSQILNFSGKTSKYGGNGGNLPPTTFRNLGGSDDSEEPIKSYQSILLQIAQNLKNIDVNVGNILQSIIGVTGKIPNNLPAIIDGQGVKTHPVEREPITDKTNYNLLHDRKVADEVNAERTAAEVHNWVQKYVEEDRKKNAQQRLNEDADQKYTRQVEMSNIVTSTPGFFGKLEDSLRRAFSSQSEADRIMSMNRDQQARLRAQRIETFGENNGRNLTDTGDIAAYRRSRQLWSGDRGIDTNKNLFQDIRLTPGFNRDNTVDTTKILSSLNNILSGPEMFKAQTGGGTLRNLLGSFTGYIGMPSLEKSRAEAEGLNQVMSNVRKEVLKLIQAIQSREMTLRSMQDSGTARFDNQGRITADSSIGAQKTFIDLEEQKGVLRGVLSEVEMVDKVIDASGGKVHNIVKNLGFVMPELMENNTILQNINAGLDKNGKALKFQTRTGEILNYSFQLMSRHIGQMVKNWMWMVNPINLIQRAFQDFASYDTKWQRTMNVIKYNLRRIIRPFMEWLAQQLVNLIGLVNSLIKGIGRAFGHNWDLFDQDAANAEKIKENLEEASQVSAGFDELHDIGSTSTSDDENSADNLLGDIYTPQWDGLNDKFKKLGETIGKIIDLISGWNFWDWLIIAGAALTGLAILKWLIRLFNGTRNPLEAVAKGFSFLEKAVGWALLIWAFTEFTKALTDFVECMKTADWEDIAKSLVMLGGAFLILVIAMRSIMKISNKLGTTTGQLFGLAALVGVFDLFVAAIIPFIECIKDLGDEKLEVIGASLMTLAMAFVALIAGVAGVEGITKLLGLDWTSLLGLAAVVVALDLFVAAIVPFINTINGIDGSKWETIGASILGLVGAFITLAAGVGLVSKFFTAMDWKAIGQLYLVAGAFEIFMLALIPFINAIKEVPFETLAGGAILIATAFLSLGGAIAILGTAFKGMPLSAFAELLVLLVAFGAIIWVLKEFVTALQGLSSEQLTSGLALLAGTIITLSVAIGVLAAVFTAVTTTGIGAVAILLLGVILGVLVAIIYAMSDFVTALGNAGEGIKAIFEGVSTVITSIADGIANVVSTIGETIIGIVEAVSEGIKTVLEPILEFIDSVLGKITNLAETIAHEIGETIRTVIETTGDVILGIIEALINAIPTLLDSILNFIREIGPALENSADAIMRTITKLINFVVSGIEYVINTLIIGTINSAISGITGGAFSNVFDTVEIPRFIPQYEQGTNYVPNNGLAYLHKGEAVIPAKYNEGIGVQGAAYQQNAAASQELLYVVRKLDNTLNQGISVNGQFVQRGSDLVAIVNKTRSQTGADLLSNVAYAR